MQGSFHERVLPCRSHERLDSFMGRDWRNTDRKLAKIECGNETLQGRERLEEFRLLAVASGHGPTPPRSHRSELALLHSRRKGSRGQTVGLPTDHQALRSLSVLDSKCRPFLQPPSREPRSYETQRGLTSARSNLINHSLDWDMDAAAQCSSFPTTQLYTITTVAELTRGLFH